MKVLCVMYSIYGGGAEKQMQYLLAGFDRSKIKPCLAVFKMTGHEHEVVPRDVPIYDLSTRYRPATLFLAFRLAQLIMQIRPDRVLSFMWSVNVVSLMAARLSGSKVRTIIAERTHLGRSIVRYPFAPVRRFFIRKLYPRAEKIIAVTDDSARNLIEEFRVPADKVTVIPNGAPAGLIAKKRSAFGTDFCERPYIIGVGGLNTTKNFPLLMNAFARLAAADKALKLLILGEGEERQALERLSAKLGLQARIALPGAVANPYPWMAGAEAFVLSSRFEGFPNVLLEAMLCGVPVVSTRCSSAVDALIEDGKTGLVLPDEDPETLARALGRLLSDPGLRKTLAANAYEKVRSGYALDAMTKKYEGLLQ